MTSRPPNPPRSVPPEGSSRALRWMVAVTPHDQRTMTLDELVDSWRTGMLSGGVECRCVGSLSWTPLRDIPEVRERLEGGRKEVEREVAAGQPPLPPAIGTAPEVGAAPAIGAAPDVGASPEAGAALEAAPAAQAATPASPSPSDEPAPGRRERRLRTPPVTLRSAPGVEALPTDLVEALRRYAAEPLPPDEPIPELAASDAEWTSLDATFRAAERLLTTTPEVTSIPPTVPSPSPLPLPPAPSGAEEAAEGLSQGSLHPVAVSRAPELPPAKRPSGPVIMATVVVAALVTGAALLTQWSGGVPVTAERASAAALGTSPGPARAGANADGAAVDDAAGVDPVGPVVSPVATPSAGVAAPTVVLDADELARELAAARGGVAPRPGAAMAAPTTAQPTPGARGGAPLAGPADTTAQPFDPAQAMATLNEAASRAGRCSRPAGPHGAGRVLVTFSPASGNVTSAVLADDFANTDVGACVVDTFMSARVAPFAGQAVSATVRFSVR